MPKIVVVGSYNRDLITYVERMPKIGETVTDGELQTLPGGKGSNQAVAVARLGAEATFIGCVADDIFGETAFDLWQSEGIDASFVRSVEGVATGTASILVDANGENIIAVASGANHELVRDDIDKAESVIAEADILLAQLEIPLAIVQYAFEMAKKHGVMTLLNPAPVRDGLDAIIALADIMTPNEGEAQALKSYLNHKTIITTLGASGARWVRDSESGIVRAFEVKAVDTVGGGDAFNGGLAVALAEGHGLDDAVRFANAVAALAVTRKGAASSMPQRDEVDAFLANNRQNT